MYISEKARIILKIEAALQKACDCCRDNIDRTEDLSEKVVRLCRELRFIEREESMKQSRRSGFTKGTTPKYPGEF